MLTGIQTLSPALSSPGFAGIGYIFAASAPEEIADQRISGDMVVTAWWTAHLTFLSIVKNHAGTGLTDACRQKVVCKGPTPGLPGRWDE